MEATRRASLLDEEARQMGARELAAGASRSIVVVVERRTTEGANIVVQTTEGVSIEVVGSGKSDPPAC